MPIRRRLYACTSLAALTLFLPIVSAPEDTTIPATIDVNAGAIQHAILSTIFGTFLEAIGRSIYGGLWSEILQNPSLEPNLWSAGNIRRMLEEEPELVRASQLGLPLPWEPLNAKQGNRYEPHAGDAANSTQSLLLMGLPGQQTGIKQKVYLPVHRIATYTGSLYARAEEGPAPLEISLRNRTSGAVLATAAVTADSKDWTRYSFDLKLKPGSVESLEPVDFVISLSGSQRVLLDQLSLMPSDNIDGMDPEVIAMSRDMKTTVLRFGGNFTSGYHWRDGIGPRDKRVSMLNLAWGIPEYNQFGTNEFLEYCRLIGAEPQIALNLGSGTPQEAADWVRYVNAHWGDHQGGLLWELGNELWGNWNTGYPTLDELAVRTKAFSDAIHAVDPKARLIATGQDPDAFEKWNAEQLKNAESAFQFLSTHFVVRDDRVDKKNYGPDFIAESSFALPAGLERKLRLMAEQIASYGWARNRVRMAFTEWLFVGDHADPAVPAFDNMGGAICAGGFLNMLMRSATIVPISDMTGIVEFAGIWKDKARVFGTPAYWTFRTYARLRPTKFVTSRTQVATYSVKDGVNRIPDIPNVPYLDVASALNDDGKLVLFCVNRDLHRTVQAKFHLSSFHPAGSATATTIHATVISDKNNAQYPDAIRPVSRALQASSDFGYAFEPASVTVIEIPRG
jgi:alpha-N-arabinofuranosidase